MPIITQPRVVEKAGDNKGRIRGQQAVSLALLAYGMYFCAIPFI